MTVFAALRSGRVQTASSGSLGAQVTALLRRLSPMLLLLVAGGEAAVLLAWLPGTVRQWLDAGPLAPGDRPMGDWNVFYDAARHLTPNGLYNPALAVIEWPFTLLPIAAAYRLYIVLAAVAVLAAAYLAQRRVRSPEAKLAVVLGVVSLPEMQFALRGAVLTPFLVLAALAGFLLLERRPRLAGLCLAILVLKPSFAVVPFAYLLYRREWRSLIAATAAAAAMTLAGFSAIGFEHVATYARLPFALAPEQGGWLSQTAQTWQHSWPGFLISIGVSPRPLIWAELIAFSAIAVYLAWRRTAIDAQLAVAALGMLLVTPYAMSYDWALLIVAGALLLRAGPPARALVPLILVAGYAAAVATQAATPYPPPPPVFSDGRLIWPHTTYGLYWTAPAALATVIVLAMLGRGSRERGARRTGADEARAAQAVLTAKPKTHGAMAADIDATGAADTVSSHATGRAA